MTCWSSCKVITAFELSISRVSNALLIDMYIYKSEPVDLLDDSLSKPSLHHLARATHGPDNRECQPIFTLY